MKKTILILIMLMMITTTTIYANEVDIGGIPTPTATHSYQVNTNGKNAEFAFITEGAVKAFSFVVMGIYVYDGHTYYNYYQGIIAQSTKPITLLDGNSLFTANGYYYGYMGAYNASCQIGFSLKEEKLKITSNANFYIDIGQFVHNNNSIQSDADEYIKNAFLEMFEGNPPASMYNLNYLEFDEEGNLIFKDKVYDLEIPLNVRCVHNYVIDIGPVEMYDNGKTKMTWEQSKGTNVQGWKTEIYYMQKGSTGKNIWNVVNKPSFETPWFFYDEVWNYLNTTTINTLSFKDTDNYLMETLGYNPAIKSVSKTNYMVRNKYVDETNGITHYSDYVYLQEDSNGNYIASVVSSSELDNIIGDNSIFTTEDIEINVDTSSDIYLGTNVTSSNNNTSFSGGISLLKGLFEDLKNFPSFLRDMFLFLPDWLITVIAAFIVVLIPLALLKMVL